MKSNYVRREHILRIALGITMLILMLANFAEAEVGLVAEYHFDGDANDSSGNGNNGIINGATFAEGIKQQALKLDGVDDYVIVPYSARFNLADMTLEAWIYVTSTGSSILTHKRVISKDSCWPGDRKLFALKSSYIKENVPAFEVLAGNTQNSAVSPTALTTGWHHLAGVRSAGNYLKLYVDGIEKASVTNTFSDAIDSNIDLNIGAIKAGLCYNGEYFNGITDEVRIYNIALSADEIKAHYDRDVVLPRPVAEYHFNGDASDSSGNGNNGIINGADFIQGVNGQALRLDGVDDYVKISDSIALDGMDQITIESWINPGNVMKGGIVTKTDPTLGASYGLSLENGNLTMGIFQSLNPISMVYITSNAKVIRPGNWTHVAGVWRGINLMELYVNGKKIPGAVGRLGTIPMYMADNDVPVNIGKLSAAVQAEFFKGLIDEARIYNAALSADEIKVRYDRDITNHFPVSQFIFSPSTPGVGENVTFNTSLTSEADGTNFSWDFGDGESGNGSKVNHSYSGTGVYTVNLTMTDNTGLTKSLSKSVVISFHIGDIPPQTAWHNQTTEFRIHSDDFMPYATYNITAAPAPIGKLSINPSSGLFSYTPDLQDKEQFYVTFNATSGNKSRSQTVEFVPMPHLPPEQTAFGLEPVHAVPDPEDKDYLLVNTVLSSGQESFNHEQRSTRNISISGKRIVFQSGNFNGLYDSYNNNPDIKNMNIYAETVIFRSPLILPQTNVVIYARELRFEGSAYIETTPITNETFPEPFASGAKGLKAGDIELHVESFYSEPGHNTRFILRGGTGQPGGKGLDGEPGQSKPILSNTPWPGHVVYEINYDQYGRRHYRGSATWPENGTNAIPGGRPGDGGNSGNLKSIPDLSAFADLNGGAGGERAKNTGGAAGTPTLAYWIVCYEGQDCEITAEHESYNGSDAIALSANNGTAGAFIKINEKESWLHPYALKMILAHAKDTYLYGHIGTAEKILENYTDVLNNYSLSPNWVNLPETQKLEFGQMQNEMQILLHSINNNLDYFGNPAGWVPMLSFEVNKAAFEQEIDRAIRVLYLSYWIGNAQADIQAKVNALTYARDKNMEEIQTLKNQYNDLMTSIPKLKSEGEAVALQENNLRERSKQLEEALIQRAQNNVEERHKVPWWKTATKYLGAACSLFPVGQPVVGFIGSGLQLISKIDEMKPEEIATEIGSISKIDYEQYGKNWADLGNEFKNIPAQFDPKSTASYLGNIFNKAKPILEEMKKYQGIIKKTEIPSSEVDAELEKIKASDPELAALADEIAKLMARKEVLGDELGKSMRLASKISNDITFDLLAIDGMNRGIADGNALLDHRASVYLKEMEQREKERLLKYHYYMAKSYEYRFLEPYPGELKLDSMFNKFKTIVDSGSGHNLTQADFDALKALYEEQLSTIVFNIYDRYQSNPPELTAPISFNLTQQEIQKLNAGETFTINLKERGIFLPSEENIRIVKLMVKNMDVHPENQNIGGWAYLNVRMEHSGMSKLVRDGEVYQFRHYNSLTENPLTWSSRYDAIDHSINSIEPSAASNSLLRSLISLSDNQLLIYSRPAAWADIKLSKEVSTGTGVDLIIDNLRLEAQYDFTPKDSDKVKLQIMSEEGLMPYFIINKKDINNRQDGRGNFHRTYYRNPGDKVTIKAPERYGIWQFEKWTDQYGRALGINPTDRVLELNLSTDQTIYAHMKKPDTTPPLSVTRLHNTTYAATYINWTWTDPITSDFAKVMIYLDGRFKTNVSKGKRFYNATGLLPNTWHTIGTHTVDTSGNINKTWINHTARTKPDSTAPRSVTNLTNRSYTSTYIKWTWTDPADYDFSKVMVYINGVFKASITKGIKYYNATGLIPNTSYRISTHTVDTSGNINKTWVNHTARTARDYTPPASVANLKNVTYKRTYINWTWKDPSTYDFAKVMVYLNGVFKGNVAKGKQYYNATVLKNNTYYKISTRTVDTSGNINMTWVNHTARTAP